MSQAGWIRRHAFGLVLSVLIVTIGLLLVVAGIGALFFLPFSEEVPISMGAPLFDSLGGILIPLVIAFVILALLTLVSAVGAGWLLVRRLEPGPRVHYWLGRLERSSDLVAQAHLSALLFGPNDPPSNEPSPEERRDHAITAAKQRYVAGELTDSEFERQLERVFQQENENQPQDSTPLSRNQYRSEERSSR